MAETPSIERIIANTINEEARGDPDALAVRIVTALGEAGYRILPANGMKETARGSQPFDALTPEMRPQDTWGDGRDWTFETSEHGGDEPDNMPQAIKATDAAGHWAIYVPLTRADKIVVPRPHSETVSSKRPEMAPAHRDAFAISDRGPRTIYRTPLARPVGRRLGAVLARLGSDEGGAEFANEPY